MSPTPFRYKQECAVTLKPKPACCNTEPWRTFGIKSNFLSASFSLGPRICDLDQPSPSMLDAQRLDFRLHEDNWNHFSEQCCWTQEEVEQSSWCLQISEHVSVHFQKTRTHLKSRVGVILDPPLTPQYHRCPWFCFFSLGIPTKMCPVWPSCCPRLGASKHFVSLPEENTKIHQIHQNFKE